MMKKHSIVTFLIGISVLFFTMCREEKDEFKVDYKYNYFPLEKGKFIVYDVDSTTYYLTRDSVQPVVTKNIYELKEVVGDTEIDNEGRTYHRIERYIRKTANDPWVLKSVWRAQIVGKRAERVEENLRFIKLVFPPQIGDSTWNGNRYINIDTSYAIGAPVYGLSMEVYKDWSDYKYTELDKPLLLNGLSFDSTLTVSQSNYQNAILIRYSLEKYAKNVGLIYKELKILETQCKTCSPNNTPCITNCQSKPWEEKAENGFILKMTAKAHN